MTKGRQKNISEQQSEQNTLRLPPGVTLLHTLRGHTDWIGRIAWSADGGMLASPSGDATIRLWNAETGNLLRTLIGHQGVVHSVAFDPGGRVLASGSDDGTIKVWDVGTGKLLRTLAAHQMAVTAVAFDPAGRGMASAGLTGPVRLWATADGGLLRSLEVQRSRIRSLAFDRAGRMLASGGDHGTIELWVTDSGRRLRTLPGKPANETIWSVAFDPIGQTLASGGSDNTVKLWEVGSGRLLRTLEGHTGGVTCVSFLSDGRLLASMGDNSVRLWSTDTGVCLGIFSDETGNLWPPGLSFHPRHPLLATVGSDPGTPDYQIAHLIHIWKLDVDLLLRQAPSISTSHYVNAKVVLLGDTGVGKSALSLVLNGEPFEATDSTPGRRVWTFQSQEVEVEDNLRQTRETLLWDLAGQPGYRVIHQLHLNEVAVALVVFDARSEVDPLAGVRHWERALRLAQQRQGASCVPMKKFLVSARSDRGTVSVSKERLEALLKEFGFDGYFETSAKEGWEIKQLGQAIKDAISWDVLPQVSSSVLFSDIKEFLLDVKKTGRLVAPASQLYDEFAHAHSEAESREWNLRAQFYTCIGRLENRDLIRRLSFGGYVLLQPELLDAYGSAMVNAAKKEPDGLGSIAEDAALTGLFYVPREQKVYDPGQQQLLLHATVEELVRHDLALRESADDGRYLVFPSEFIRDYEAAPEPKGKALAMTFDGPAQSLYSTLAVRLGHSGLFTTGRAEMWRNAAVFTAKAGGKCGLYLHEFEEARGRIVIFYELHEGQLPSNETRFNFEEFVLAHTQRRALDGSVNIVRFFVCGNCGNPVPDNYVTMLRGQGQVTFDCPCRSKVSLAEPKERLHFMSKVEAMEQSADRQRDFEIFVESARGEMSTPSFRAWVGDDRATLAIAFTDVVDSTALGEELKEQRMNELRRPHFAQSRKLIDQYNGREIKTIGDSFMAAFRSVEKALDYALALQANPGHAKVRVRAGIHIGPMTVEKDDVFGGSVNFAARVVDAIRQKAEIWLSDRAKDDLDRSGITDHERLTWQRHSRVKMKGFTGAFTLWSLRE
jgi:WD40 repeat protein/class 3 adenylate cyclase